MLKNTIVLKYGLSFAACATCLLAAGAVPAQRQRATWPLGMAQTALGQKAVRQSKAEEQRRLSQQRQTVAEPAKAVPPRTPGRTTDGRPLHVSPEVQARFNAIGK